MHFKCRCRCYTQGEAPLDESFNPERSTTPVERVTGATSNSLHTEFGVDMDDGHRTMAFEALDANIIVIYRVIIKHNLELFNAPQSTPRVSPVSKNNTNQVLNSTLQKALGHAFSSHTSSTDQSDQVPLPTPRPAAEQSYCHSCMARQSSR